MLKFNKLSKNRIILVDQNDKKIGIDEKLKTHQQGDLHRAFSVFIFNSNNELLLQKRAKLKYHSGGLWTNTCCSHPYPGDSLKEAVHRRLKEEMGFDCELKEIFSFSYKVDFGSLIENEFDHVFMGKFNGTPQPNPKEIEDWQWLSIEKIEKDIKRNPKKYSFWLKIIFEKYLNYFRNNLN